MTAEWSREVALTETRASKMRVLSHETNRGGGGCSDGKLKCFNEGHQVRVHLNQ